MAAIVTPEFTKIVTGLIGAEGPVFTKDGDMYMVAPEVEVDGQYAGEVVKVDITNKQVSVLCKPVDAEYGGIPAGCQCDPDNNIWIADMRLGLLKVHPDGSYQQIVKKDDEGRMMQGCNDCAFDYDGNLWITAPAGEIAPSHYERSSEKPFGSLYCYTKDGIMKRIDTGYQFCNGIAVQHSSTGKPEKLIVAETPKKTLWSYQIEGPGIVKDKKIWGKLTGNLEGGPDGMDFDADGNLIAAHWGSSQLEVFGPDGGDPITLIKCPFSGTSNLHFRPNSNEIFVTEHDSHALWSFEWKTKGKKQYCEM